MLFYKIYSNNIKYKFKKTKKNMILSFETAFQKYKRKSFYIISF